jgi:tRNA threonylcarbamoyladenosine biosynthesis protein TsaB
MLPIILYIDTSSKKANYLLVQKGTILAKREHVIQNEHGQTINQYIDELLAEVDLTLTDLSAVAVANGPGSYTGLRISLATAKGLCYAYSTPLILINNLDIMHQHCISFNGNKAILLEAREGEYYTSFYNEKGELILKPSILFTFELLERLHFHAATVYSLSSIQIGDYEQSQLIENDDTVISNYIFKLFDDKLFADLFNSEPFYIKNVHINKINKL